MVNRRRQLTPLVDTNTLLAIESLFGKGAIDPWAMQLACTFTDVFIYADHFRFTFGSPDDTGADIDLSSAPAIVQCLRRRDSSAVVAQIVPTNEPVTLQDKYVEEAFGNFANWARINPKRLRLWLNTHDTASIRAMQRAQVAREYYFNLDRLNRTLALKGLTTELQTQDSQILYAFDNVLRAPLYGELTGSGQHYLNHPTRNASLIPTYKAEVGSLPEIAVSFAESISGFVKEMSSDEYCIMLHTLRGAVRSRGIHELGPGDVEKDVLRDIAASDDVDFPPRLKKYAKSALIGGGVIGGLAAIPALGPAAAVAGALISVSSAIWDGGLPRKAGRIKWLRWAFEWDLEKQDERRD